MRYKYNRSICSTCRFISICELTTDKSNITVCSEYEHYLDEGKANVKHNNGNFKRSKKNQRQLVLNKN